MPIELQILDGGLDAGVDQPCDHAFDQVQCGLALDRILRIMQKAVLGLGAGRDGHETRGLGDHPRSGLQHDAHDVDVQCRFGDAPGFDPVEFAIAQKGHLVRRRDTQLGVMELAKHVTHRTDPGGLFPIKPVVACEEHVLASLNGLKGLLVGCPEGFRCRARAKYFVERIGAAEAVIGGGMAFEVMSALRNVLGLRIPEDVSLIGFDDVPMAGMPEFALTTIRQPLSQMVANTTRMMVEAIRDRDAEAENIAFAPKLVTRATVRRRPE